MLSEHSVPRPSDHSAGDYADRLVSGIAASTRDDRAEVMDFRARMYGPDSAFADPAWVRWLYDEAPGTASEGRHLWIWRHEGRIAAHQGAILTRVRVGDSERTLAWMLDLMVSPAHRLRGVGSVLPRVALRGSEAAGGTEVSEAAQKAFLRLGWSHLGTLPLWFHPFDPTRILRARASRLPAGLIGPPLRVAFGAVRLASRARAFGRRLVPMDRFDERADTVWNLSAAHWPVIARRDRAWLEWRWDACPRRDGAWGVWMERDGETIGWAMLRCREHLGISAGFIVDLLCPPDELGSLVALCTEELRQRQVAAAYCLLRAPRAGTTLAACGYVRRDSGFAMMSYSNELPPEERNALADPERWFVTSGDSDLDRPRENTMYA